MSKSCNILDRDLALDVLIDLEISEYSDEDLKEFISKIKSQTNEGKSPITEKTLELLKEVLIDSAEEDEVEFNTEGLDDKLIKYWNEKAPSRSSLDTSKYISDIYEEIPILNNGLFSIFNRTIDRNAFSKWAEGVLVNATAVNPTSGEEVSTEFQLNMSLLSLQNDLAQSLCKFLEIEPVNIYEGNKFLKNNYDTILKAARLRFYSYLDNGKYDFPTRGIRGEFNKYLLLTNFDSAISKYAKGIIDVDPSQKGSKELFSKGSKYKLGSLHVKQVYDDSFESSSINVHTNKSVQQYISSLPEINSKGVMTGNTVLFRDFNNLIRIIKDSNPKYSGALRDYPGEALKKVMDEIFKNPSNYFSGNDTILLNTFYTIYNNVFRENGISLYSKNASNTRSSKNNLYSMIVNHINKNTSMEYTQTIWDEEGEEYKTNLLSSVNLTKNKTDIGRNLTLHAIKDDYSDLFDKYRVVFNTQNSKIKSVSFTIGQDSYTINFDKNDVPTNVESIIKKFSEPEYIQFFNDVFKQREDKDFYSGMLVSTPLSSNIYKLLNLASNIFLSNKLGSDLSISDITDKLVDGIVDSTRYRNWYNSDFNALRVEGFNGALDAVETLARAKSYINKDSTFSNVKNSEGSSLPKFGLSSLSEGDKYLFHNLFNQVLENPKHTLRHNLFMNKKIYELVRNTFKTEFVDYEGNSRQIKEMSDSELIYDYIVSGYFANKNKFISIQPAVYADKSKIQVKTVDTHTKFSYTNIDGKVIIDNKSFSKLTPRELDDLYYETMRGQMTNLKETLRNDYIKFFRALHDLFPRRYSEPDSSWSYDQFEPEVNKLNKSDIYTAIKYLQEKGEDITILPELHYTWNKKKKRFEFNNLLKFTLDEFTVNKDLFKEKNSIEETLFAESIRKGGIRLSTRLANGKENKIITSNINKEENQLEYLSDRLPKEVVNKLTKNGASYEKVWINNDTKELISYLAFDKDFNIITDEAMPLYDNDKDLGITVVLNPELYKFQRLDNVISNNYNLATVGHPFLHPTKVFAKDRTPRGIKEEEASRTVAFSKRGVIYGGTGHTLIKNKKDGIPQYLNISVIDDLEAPNMSLSGDNDDATTQDGSIHTNPFFARWFANSSPELVHSSVHEKPLGFSSLSRYASSTLFKCATFVITNSSIRSSETSKVNKGSVLKNMTDRPWVIPNLNLSEYFQSVYFCDPNLDLNKHFKLVNITKEATKVVNGKVDNVYYGQVVEVDERGNQIGVPELRTFHINSNYDLWKVLGGAYSQSFVNGVLQNSEDSITQVARIANEVNLTEDSPEIAEYNELVRSGQLLTNKLAEISKISNILTVPQYSKKLIPEKYLKIDSGGVTYYQPMKYSDVHYLANASGVKNGIVNLNPAKIYYNSTKERVDPESRVIFGHPTLGKTMASKMGYNFISFDDYNRDKINKFISEHKLPEESKYDYKKRRDPEYQEFLLSLLEENLDLDVPVFFSDTSLLDAINNSDDMTIDEIYTMSEDNFIERAIQRGSKEEDIPDLKDWKANLDLALNQYIESDPSVKVTDATGHDLYEYFDSNLITSEFDPSYLIIQLTAEHDVENEEVSEMTQVISALEQGSYTHDLAIQILSDIGQTISDKLNLYNKWDVNTEIGRKELNTILGRALCRVFNDQEDQISIASAYLEKIREELSKSNIITSDIPFDDNNLLGMFETNFRNGFNRDVIKRKFSGFTGVMAPCFDMYSVYDFDGKVISAQDFAKVAQKNGTATLEETLQSLDVEVPVSQIRCGDWVEIDGKPVQVGTLTSTFGNTSSITLEEIKNMRGNTIKRLSSKGRNLRAQNYSVQVSPDQVNSSDNSFDIYDLDSVLLSHKLDDYIKNYNLDNPQYLDLVFLEINELIKNKYRTEDSEIDLIPILKSENVDKLKSYIKVAIQQDTKDITSGKYHIPIKYRKGNLQYADIISSEYSPNELAVAKPFASKFLLSQGDTIGDINVQFFINKLKERRSTPIYRSFYNFYFVGNNYKLHFSYDPNVVSKLRKAGYTVSIKNVESETIYTNDGFKRQVNEDISYPISKDMVFYEVTSPDGEKVELVTNFSSEDVKNIWSTENFYTNTFNFSNFSSEYKDQETLDKNFGRLSNLLKLYGFINKVKAPIGSYKDAFTFASSINPELEDTKRAYRMYQSFNEALKVIAARIPAQSMQSFMNMKIASFIDTDTNIVYVPIEMLIYEGSDFDIDKIYVMNSSIGDNGVYISWSPYFMWETTELFEKSKELPLPNGRRYTLSKDGLDVSEYNNLEDLYEAKKYGEFLDRLAELLNKVNDADFLSGATDYLLNLINTHNGFQYNKSEGVKNKIFNNMYKISSDPRNYLAATATLTIDPARKAAESSTAGKFGAVSSNDNPGAKMIAQRQNAVGKSSIGSYANGIKAFSSLLVFYQDSLSNIINVREKFEEFLTSLAAKLNVPITEVPSMVELYAKRELLEKGYSDGDADKIIGDRKLDFKYVEGFSYLNILSALSRFSYMSDINKFKLSLYGESEFKAYDTEGSPMEIKFTPTLPNLNLSQDSGKLALPPNMSTYMELSELIERIKKGGIQEEVYETLGVMLNISTDNAKELVLEKINASGDLAKVYIYLISCGVPFKTITKFMTSDIISLVNKKAQKSIFNEESNSANITKAISFYLNGADLREYVGKDYSNSVLTKLKSLIDSAIPTNLADFTEFIAEADESYLTNLMKKITENEKEFRLYKSKSMSEEEAAAMAEMYEALGEDVSFASKKDQKDLAFLVNRFLKDSILRKNQLKTISISEDKISSTLNLLSNLVEGGNEISEYSQWCGINQGLKTLRNDFYNFIRRRENFISRKTGHSFDLLKFIKDPDYKIAQIHLYELNKTTFNILEAISSSPHFSKMYEALALNEDVLNTFSYKYRTFTKLADLVIGQGIVTSIKPDTLRIIKRFVDDVTVSKFFDDLNFRIPSFGKSFDFYNPDGSTSNREEEYIQLDDVFGRASFKRIMEKYIIPDLKNKYPNNRFLSDLMYGFVKTSFGVRDFVKLPIDLNNVSGELSENLFTEYVNGFNSIRKDTYMNTKIGDLFFVYNLLVNNNGFGPQTLTRLFEDSIKDNDPDSVISKFSEFESKLPSLDIDFDPRDLLIRFAGKDGSGFDVSYNNGKKSILYNGDVLDLFTSDNPASLFFQNKTTKIYKEKVDNLYTKLMDLFAEDKLQIKLTCDE